MWQPNRPVVCADGFTISVQASEYTYCSPRVTGASHYTMVECGFPSERPEPWHYWQDYCEDPSNPTETVYAYVPVRLVRALIEAHGGMVDGEIPGGVL